MAAASPPAAPSAGPGAGAGADRPTVDFFVSYAREDLRAVGELVRGLRALGREVWVDLEGLYAGEAWWPSLCRAIGSAQVVVFVLSPHWLQSGPCRSEYEQAEAGGKRIVPLALQDIDASQLPEGLSRRHWLLAETGDGDTEARFARLARALVDLLLRDPAWLRGHTRWLLHAQDWETRGRPDDLLLRGPLLAEAEAWLQAAPASANPPATPLHHALIDASATLRRLEQARAALDDDRRPARALALLLAGEDGLQEPRVRALALQALQQARRGQRLAAMPRGGARLCLDREGKRLLAGDALGSSLWDLEASPARRIGGELGGLFDGEHPLAPDGRRLLDRGARDDRRGERLRLLDTDRLQPVAEFELGEDEVAAWAFSPDGRLLALACGSGLRLIDAEDGRIRWQARHETAAGRVRLLFSPDGMSLASWSGDGLRLWVVADGKPSWQAAAGTRSVFWSMRFSPDGAWLVAARGNPRVATWRCDTGEALKPLSGSPGSELRDAWFGEGGTIFAQGSELRAWSWPDRRLRWARPAGQAAAWSNDGRHLACVDERRHSRIELVDARSGRLVETLAHRTGDVVALGFLAGDEALVTGSDDGWLTQWDLNTRTVAAELRIDDRTVTSLAPLPAGKAVVAASIGTPGLLWSFDHGLAERELEGRWRSVMPLPGAGLLALMPQGPDDPVLLLGPDGEQVVARLGADHGRPFALAASPDGQRLAMACTDGLLRLVQRSDWRELQRWPDLAGRSGHLHFDAGGQRLLAHSWHDGACRVLDLAGGPPLLGLGDARRHVEQARLSPDGRLVACAERHYEVIDRERRHVGNGARIVEVAGGATACTFERWPGDRLHPTNPRNSFDQLAFSPDGRSLLMRNTFDGAICLADVATGALRVLLDDDEQRPEACAWTPDGRVVASGHGRLRVLRPDDGAVQLDREGTLGDGRQWSAAHGLVLCRHSHGALLLGLPEFEPWVELFDAPWRFPNLGDSSALSPDGQRVLTVESDHRACTFAIGGAALLDAARRWAEPA